ncbi:ABC transporter ATP-binding protein [Ponticoccus alexandrii]|uniref:ATP-binding cassette domain-containing protein n=1 Tax=Ponticoccus alexandrii TaxID=1943633 RepID=A0ABX7FAA0_9RHOB|nr:ABC transporter ATP-binding protein [Ponticoccus alexandrii]ETA49748.1 ABC transporter ATP-binding protein [Rhodobacteraceae bacterium PD-2]QRF67473.1 ATP-binding cassette domain-containing protein [Ponticoccus alexandrii]
MTLLTVRDLAAFYGASQALFSVSFDIAEGEVLALMGRNGMGKTTTIRSLCRLLPASGTMRFADRDLSRLKPHQAARLGIGLVPEGRRCFADLTVTENLTAAARPGPWDRAAVTALFPRLAERSGQVARSLSGGEQQMLAIGRALMTNPRLLVLDEATEGLAPMIRQEIWAALSRLKRETGMAILIVDKSLKELTQVADRAVILSRGRSEWTGPLDRLTPEETTRYLGV